MKQASLTELITTFTRGLGVSEEDQTRAAVSEKITSHEGAISHLVLFRNEQLDSSEVGRMTLCLVGPGCTYKSIAELEGKHLNDLPSQRQYPLFYCEV
jgi:hypothetical protein